jgi:hypothetical protein
MNSPGSEERITLAVQAYADALIFASRKIQDTNVMLAQLQDVANWSKMEVNAKKSVTALSMLDLNRGRSSLKEQFTFGGASIRQLSRSIPEVPGNDGHCQANRETRSAEDRLAHMRTRLQMIMQLPLLNGQKILAIETFLIPMLDFNSAEWMRTPGKPSTQRSDYMACQSNAMMHRGETAECPTRASSIEEGYC